MAKSQVGVTSPNDNQERLDRPTGGENPRARLLAEVPVTDRRLRLAGLLTAVLEGGDGPPVVLLHGPGEFAAKWLRVIPDLTQTNRVIAPDLPAHGESEPFDGPPDIDRVVAWLDDLIESTCGMPPVLVGQTIGGAMAAHFAIHRGDRVSGLVLVDTLGLQPFQPAPEFGLALMSFVSEPTEDTHDRLWSHCAFNLDGLRHEMGARWDDFKAYNLDRAHAPDLRPAQHALMESYGMPAIPAADLTRIAVPTMLIWGRHDLATPVSVAEATRGRYGWPLRVIENAADDPPLEQPEAFLQALRAALRELARVAQRGAAQRRVKEETW